MDECNLLVVAIRGLRGQHALAGRFSQSVRLFGFFAFLLSREAAELLLFRQPERFLLQLCALLWPRWPQLPFLYPPDVAAPLLPLSCFAAASRCCISALMTDSARSLKMREVEAHAVTEACM